MRHQWRNSPGPRPLRSKQWPYGFPWLAQEGKATVRLHNYFVERCCKIAHTAHKAGATFIWEHPEDLGLIPSVQESPASIWQMTEVRNLVKTTQGTIWAIYQCHFGADSPKPTRFISNRDFQQQFSGFASFNADNTYVGPLPQQCGHRFHVKKLIGKHEGQWRTSPSAAYPSGVCKYLAKLLLSRFEGECGHLDINTEKPLQQPQPGVQQKQADTTGDSPPSTSSDTVSEAKDMSIQGEDQQSPTPGHQPTIENATCAGSPIQCNWDGDYHFLADGFGLCSPNRWHPRDRCCFEEPDSKTFTSKIFSLLDQAVTQHLGDARKAAFELALGRMQGSPFSEETLTGLRRTWASLFPRPETTGTPSEGQPFFLELMSQSLQILGDPDWRILTQDKESFATGVPLGYDQPLPRVPQVFPPKEKHRKLDDSEFSEVAQNYKSADEMAAELEKKFREEEKQGRMFPATMGSLKQDFPGCPVLVAAMGAIKKPNGDVRPLHDGTHHVQVNNCIKSDNQLQYPGPGDAAALVEVARASKEACFAMLADISSAHRLVKIRRQDWPLLCCRAHSASPVIWVNTVGTFGISSAAEWWTRLFALVGRLVTAVLRKSQVLQLAYVDDLHVVRWGDQKFKSLWMLLLAYEILGTPFGYHKFKGGLEVQFVGYELNYLRSTIGISNKRATWLAEFVVNLQRASFTTSMRDFNEFLGRLGFVARVLTWIKPHLAPLYSWSAVVDKFFIA